MIGEGFGYVTPDSVPAGQTAPFDISVESAPNQQIAFASYNVQSQEYSMINNELPKMPPPPLITVPSQQAPLSANATTLKQQMLGITMPIEFNPFSHGMAFSNLTFYMNNSDGHYHIKGWAQNTLPKTRSGYIGMTILFEDKATGTSVKSAFGLINGPIDPKTTIPFDIDTGYTQGQSGQFQYLKVQITGYTQGQSGQFQYLKVQITY
jgi:hypothetical protein